MLFWWSGYSQVICHPLLLLPPIPPSIRIFSNESVLCIRWPKDWSFSFSISPSNDYSGLISFRTDWFQIGKGVCQGCILSLCLFDFYAEFSSVQSLSHVRIFATPWTAALQASLSISNCWSLLKLMSIELVMPSNHLIFCCPFPSCPHAFPGSGSFPVSQLFASGGQSTGVSASTSVLPMNTQNWSPLGWTGWISLQSKGLSRVFSNVTVQKH